MASLTNLRDSTGDPSWMALDSILGYWPSSTAPGHIVHEIIPDGYHDTYFTRVAFKYSIFESDEYHKPWDGVTVGIVCTAKWVTTTTVTTYTPGEEPVVVETVEETPNNIQFSRNFVKSDWVYDPIAPSQLYEKEGAASYNFDTDTWDITNPDLVGDEFKYRERTYTIVYSSVIMGAYVETDIQSSLVIVDTNPTNIFQPFFLEYCTNPGFWTG